MSWGSAITATQLTSITTEQFFSFATPISGSLVLLNPGEQAHLHIKSNPPVTPTDHLIVAIYATNDGTNYDLTPYMEFTIDKALDPNRVSCIVSGVYGFKVGVRRSGTTDTYTDADATIRLDGVSL